MAVRIQMRRGTTSEWNAADPTLNEGEIGYNTTLAAFKIGDGETIWSELDYYQTASSITPAEVGAIALTEKGAANGVAELNENLNVLTQTAVVFEGTTNNEFETTLLVTDPTADNTVTIPNITGTLITSGDTGTVTNTMLAGSIANNKLSNSAITINGTPVSLGGSITLPGDIEGVTAGTGLSGGGTSGTVTLNIDANVVATTNNTLTLSNKTISGNDNTLSNIANSSLTNSSITINGTSVSLGGTRTLITDNIAEAVTSPTNLWFTDARARGAITSGTGITYAVTSGTIAIDSSVATTSGVQTLTNKTLGASTTLSADLSAATYKVVNLGAPTASTDAATKAYVDSVAEGLHVHASVATATTNNISLDPAPASIDGVTLTNGMRVLVKNQSTTSQNGIYAYASTSTSLVRASDYDTASEIQSGDFVFVSGGTVNSGTGYVQTEIVTTLGTDPIVFTQFSGAGTFLAGNGLSLTGNTFSINTAITVDLNTGQTLTNKTLTSPSVGTSLTTASTSFDLLNATATTLNFAGAATALTIGATSGTTTVRNDFNLASGKSYKINNVNISAALPALTWGEVKNGKSGLAIS
jgi:hypothetical protein